MKRAVLLMVAAAMCGAVHAQQATHVRDLLDMQGKGAYSIRAKFLSTYSQHDLILLVEEDDYVIPVKLVKKDLGAEKRFLSLNLQEGDVLSIRGNLSRLIVDEEEYAGLVDAVIVVEMPRAQAAGTPRSSREVPAPNGTATATASATATATADTPAPATDAAATSDKIDDTAEASDAAEDTDSDDFFEEPPRPIPQFGQVKPSFRGGDIKTFTEWVNRRVVYPETWKPYGLEGRVTVQFTVERDGTVSNVKIARGENTAMDREALRVVSMSPRWAPGYFDGNPVKVNFTMTVVFQCPED